MTTQQDERAAFEAEYRLMFPVSSADPKKFEQNGTGGYEDFQVNNAWRFWQARAQSHREALAQHRAALEKLVGAVMVLKKYADPVMKSEKTHPSNAQWAVEKVMQEETFISDAITEAERVLEGGGV